MHLHTKQKEIKKVISAINNIDKLGRIICVDLVVNVPVNKYHKLVFISSTYEMFINNFLSLIQHIYRMWGRENQL